MFFRRLFRTSKRSVARSIPSPFVVDELPLPTPIDAPAEPQEDSMKVLRDEVRKLGRSQFKANSVADSERKRIQQLLEQMLATSQQPQKDAFSDLLEVVDGLEAAMQHTEQLQIDQAVVHAWQSGLQLLHERMLGALRKWRITPIPALGEAFDPNYHQAVDVTSVDDVPLDTVVEEQRRGYLYQGEVLRYSEVIVARRQEN